MCIRNSIQLSSFYYKFDIQEYRNYTNETKELNNSNSDVFIQTLTDSQWMSSQTNISNQTLPFIFNGSNGLMIEFQANKQSYYTIRIQFNYSDIMNQTNLSFFLNSQVLQQQNINQTYIIKLSNIYINYTQKIVILTDLNITIQNIIIYQSVQNISTYINLIHYPSKQRLLVITDILLEDVQNISNFQQQISVILWYLMPYNLTCLASNFTQTNPADFGEYTNTTNFENQSLNYLYSIYDPYYNNTDLTQNDTKYLIIIVDNIKVDCSVHVNISLPNGKLLKNNQNYIFFNQQINQTVKTIESVISINVSMVIFIYYITNDLITINFDNPLFCNPKWDRIGLNNTNSILIDNVPCVNVTFPKYPGFSQFNCNNQSQITLQSTLNFNFPNFYLRKSITNQLLNLTVSYSAITPFKFLNSYNQTSSVIYYIKQQTLNVIIDIVILPSWANMSIVNCFNIFVDGIKINASQLYLKSNSNKYIQIQTVLPQPLNSSSSVTVNSTNVYGFKTIEGYDSWFKFPVQNPPISFKQSMYITTPFLQSFNGLTFLMRQTVKYNKYFGRGLIIFIFSYFITNFITFQNLTFLYYFVQFKFVLHYYRKIISDILLSLQENGGWQYFFQQIFHMNIQLTLNNDDNNYLQSIQVPSNILKLSDYGYSTNTFITNFQFAFIFVFVGIKLLFVKIVSYIPLNFLKRFCRYILKLWKQIVFTQVIVGSPQFIVILPYHFKRQFRSNMEKFSNIINFLGIVIISYLCFLAVFYVFLGKLQGKSTKKTDEKPKQSLFNIKNNNRISDVKNGIKNDAKQKKQQAKIKRIVIKRKKQIIQLVDNFMYILIPLLVGVGSVPLFIISVIIITFFRLILLIRYRIYYTRIDFIKQLVNKFLWVCFTIVYLLYWIIQIFNFGCEQNQSCIDFRSICDLIQSFIFVGGCLLQIFLLILFGFYYFVFSIIQFYKASQKLTQIKEIQQNRENKSRQLSLYKRLPSIKFAIRKLSVIFDKIPSQHDQRFLFTNKTQTQQNNIPKVKQITVKIQNMQNVEKINN